MLSNSWGNDNLSSHQVLFCSTLIITILIKYFPAVFHAFISFTSLCFLFSVATADNPEQVHACHEL